MPCSLVLGAQSAQRCARTASGLRLSQSVRDAAAYYEQAGRTSLQMRHQLQWVLPDGMQWDTRLVFGFAGEPSTMNRFSFHLVWRVNLALDREQCGWEQFCRGWRACI